MRRSWIHLSTEASNFTFAMIKVCVCILGKGRWELADLEKWGLQSPYNYTKKFLETYLIFIWLKKFRSFMSTLNVA